MLKTVFNMILTFFTGINFSLLSCLFFRLVTERLEIAILTMQLFKNYVSRIFLNRNVKNINHFDSD